jgi:hypothetical protein
MTTTSVEPRVRNARRSPLTVAGPAAALCLAVVVIHFLDQGGFPGSKEPTYVGIGYYLLELGGLIAAGMLLSRLADRAWPLAFAVGAGPFLGFIWSRGPGMPSYTDDKGNWTEPIGMISLVVEGLLVVVSAYMLWRQAQAD